VTGNLRTAEGLVALTKPHFLVDATSRTVFEIDRWRVKKPVHTDGLAEMYFEVPVSRQRLMGGRMLDDGAVEDPS